MIAPTIVLRPKVAWPREITPGQRYLVTVDLEHTSIEDWPYEGEDYPITCVVTAEGDVEVEVIGSPTLILHRFGGTYGPARFLVNATRPLPEDGTGTALRLTLLSAGGAPIRKDRLPIGPARNEERESRTTVIELPAMQRPTETASPSREPVSAIADPPVRETARDRVRLVDRERSRIVLIGTSRYRDSKLPDLPAVADNLVDLAAAFTNPGLGNFPSRNCVIVANGSLADVGVALDDAVRDAEDTLLVYYAGHGLLDQSGKLYLSLGETQPTLMRFTALQADTLRDVLMESRARNRVIILDCSYSGRATIGPTFDDQMLAQFEAPNTYLLTASRARQHALVMPGERNTLFTGQLLDVLRSGSSTAGAVLGLEDVYHALRERAASRDMPTPTRLTIGFPDIGLVANRAAVAEQQPAQTTSTPFEPPVLVRAGAQPDDGPYLFLSYAHEPSPNAASPSPSAEVKRFVRDLSSHIRDLVDFDGDIGFLDRTAPQSTRWTEEVEHAIATCRIFVPLYTPGYFHSQLCGREWYAFHRREVDSWALSGQEPMAIFPVLWRPGDGRWLPPAVKRIQYASIGFTEDYPSIGMEGLMRQSSQYKTAVNRLARIIVDRASTRAPLAAAPQVDRTLTSGNAFIWERRPATLIVLAATYGSTPGRLELRSSPYYTPEVPTAWNPYAPEVQIPLARYVSELVECMGLDSATRWFDELPTTNHEPLLLLVDPWALLDEERKTLATAFYQTHPWARVLVPWNAADTQTTGHREILRRVLGEVFPAGATFLESLEEVGNILPQAVNDAFDAFTRSFPGSV